ncbi:hypothetical protein [Paenibacillus lactis]|uniref:Uncharacterized protein n=1 Tax=Paenibacillus lactis 154 TaxID=743719 RepID=G4HIX8_9BACL|nr:hypothetical protein [Paenibacillus lactis]EHB62696.1 hypothetical protein PaelaDRAFT_3939 [Paenibacillus lactis 154]
MGLQQFVREKGYLKESSTWPVLLRWTYGILNGFPEYSEVEQRYLDVKEEANEFLRKVYFANVKKIAGGVKANHTDVERHMKATGELLYNKSGSSMPTWFYAAAMLYSKVSMSY